MLSLFLFDSAFANGSYAHSFALESAINDGRVKNAAGFERWARVYFAHAFAKSDALAFALAFDAAQQARWLDLARIARTHNASFLTAELAAANVNMCAATLKNTAFMHGAAAAAYARAVSKRSEFASCAVAFALLCAQQIQQPPGGQRAVTGDFSSGDFAMRRNLETNGDFAVRSGSQDGNDFAMRSDNSQNLETNGGDFAMRSGSQNGGDFAMRFLSAFIYAAMKSLIINATRAVPLSYKKSSELIYLYAEFAQQIASSTLAAARAHTPANTPANTPAKGYLFASHAALEIDSMLHESADFRLFMS